MRATAARTDGSATEERFQIDAPPPRAGDGFSPYAVSSRSGPHVTIQAGVVQGGRFYTTTSRRSLKARSVRAHGVAAAVIDADDGTSRIVAGETSALDITTPLTLTDDPVGTLLSGPAALCLAGNQLEQLLGYLESARWVPADWLPHRRVLLATRIDRSLVLDGFDVVDSTGAWAPAAVTPGGDHPLEPTPAPARRLALVPGEVRHLLRTDAPARLGVTTPEGPVALPARWLGEDRFQVSADALRHIGATLPGLGSVTFDDSSSRRPDEKLGVLLRGSIALVDVDGPRATIAVHAGRVTTWNGFRAQTTDAVDDS